MKVYCVATLLDSVDWADVVVDPLTSHHYLTPYTYFIRNHDKLSLSQYVLA